MKLWLSFTLVCVALSFAWLSCSSSEDSGPSNTGGCQGAGELGSPNQIHCCGGLQATTNYQLETDGGCTPVVESGKHLVCIACGDGNCESGETTCNCPADCP